MNLPASVRIVEVGPRDGLQNETHPVPTPFKIAFIDRLSRTGLRTIEATAFVSPNWVPQMSDARQVMREIGRAPGVRYPVLVPNVRGLEAAMEAGAHEVAVFAAASESFSRSNINCSIDESLLRYEKVCKTAEERSIPVRGYVSCALGCPFEGKVAVESVVRVALRLYELGCHEISLGDTIGVGTAVQAQEMAQAVAERIPKERIALHFHDTYGQALVNILACMQVGISVFDTSTGGLGGCPYARGATGNVATEDVVYMLDGLGIDTGVNLKAVVSAAHFICDTLGKVPSSRVARAMHTALV